MKMAVLEGSRGVGDNTTEIRVPLPGWTLISITGLVSDTTAEVHEHMKNGQLNACTVSSLGHRKSLHLNN